MRRSAHHHTTLLLLLPFLALSLGQQDFQCPELFGNFEDPVQCDLYWNCEEGFATPLLCKDGLVFDYFKSDSNDPCDTPYVADCGARKELQQPSFPSDVCPRLYGTFADPDPSVCDTYYNCIDGKENQVVCSPGLHFDEIAGTCAWPRDAKRTGCGQKKAACKKLPGGKGEFCCPAEEQLYQDGTPNPHPTYANLEDCQLFWVCLNGQEAVQEGSCTAGEVFNEKTFKCDFPENVPECVGWYANDPLFADYYYDEPVNNAASAPAPAPAAGTLAAAAPGPANFPAQNVEYEYYDEFYDEPLNNA